MIKISIIMPLYNAERFLKETLESVKKQTLQEYEIICINDGSEDNTIKIVEEYAKKDHRYVILNNKKREGAAFARNKGVQAARGEYLSFLDGDDIFDERMLEQAYQTAKKFDLDMVLFSGIHVLSENIYVKRKTSYSREFVTKFCMQTFCIEDCKISEALAIPDHVWDRLFKRQYILDNKIVFQNLSCCNDALFGALSLLLAKKIRYLYSDRVMVYVRDHETASRISHHRDPRCAYYVLEELEKELINRNCLSMYSRYFFYYTLFLINIACSDANDDIEREKFIDFLANHGISNLINCSHGEYDKCDEILKDAFEDVRNNRKIDFSILKCRVYEKISKMEKYILEKKEENKKIALWGAGTNGIEIIDALLMRKVKIDYIIDVDENKQGNQVRYLAISKPSEIISNIDIIIASNEMIYQELICMLDKSKIELVNYFDV